MAYTVLARRYRSGTFDEVIGQDRIAQTLKRAIESGRIAHAYLFTGTRGVGKTSMARILAKALNCLKFDAPTTTPCGQCTSCQAIARGEDIDVIEIDAASNRGIDNVRDLITNSQFRPARARFKIFIIDEVHMLTKESFNALLKVMEEPPEHVKFILATTEADKILPTILSRCQRYDFRNIPTKEIVAHLKRIVNDEKVDATDEALQLVARAGAGSMRDSLSLLDRLLSVGEKKLTAEMIEQLLGMPRATLLFDLANAIGAGDVKATLAQSNAIITGGLATDTLIGALVDHFHNLLVLNTCGADSELVDIVGLDAKELEAQAKLFDPAILTQDISILEELRRQMRSSQTGRALLDATLARLAMAGQLSSVRELIARLDGNGAPPRAMTAPRTATPTPASAAQKKTLELATGGRGSEVAAAVADLKSQASTLQAPISVSSSEVSDSRSPISDPKSEISNLKSTPTDPGHSTDATSNDDALPAVGKVAEEGATRSIWQAFQKAKTPATIPARPASGQGVTAVSGESARFAALQAQVSSKLKGTLAGMFGSAQLVAVDESAGTATLWFGADDSHQGDYVLRNVDPCANAFAEVLGKPVRLEIRVEPPAPVVYAERDEPTTPRVVRPRIEDVAQETADAPAAPVAIDLTPFTSDPLVKAILEAFPNSRVYPPR